jgi:hypothetical protein
MPMRQNTNPTGRIEWPNLADNNLQQQQMTVDSLFVRSSFSYGSRLLFAKSEVVVDVERRHIVCNQIVRRPEDTDYATLPLFLTRNDDLRKLWMKKSAQ